MIEKKCYKCLTNKPLTSEFFIKDSTRKDGFSYECKLCHKERKKGRDRRKERWTNMTDEQKNRKKALAKKYSKTLRGRAIHLRKAYQRIDECDLTTEEVMELISKPCVHCGTTKANIGLDRIDNSLPHIKTNVAPSCAPCNFARGDRFTFEEMQILGKTISLIMDNRAKTTQNEGRL